MSVHMHIEIIHQQGAHPFATDLHEARGGRLPVQYKNPLISTHRTALPLGSPWARTTTPRTPLAYLVVGCIAGIKASHIPTPKVDTNQGLRESTESHTIPPLQRTHSERDPHTVFSTASSICSEVAHTAQPLSDDTPNKTNPTHKSYI